MIVNNSRPYLEHNSICIDVSVDYGKPIAQVYRYHNESNWKIRSEQVKIEGSWPRLNDALDVINKHLYSESYTPS